MWYNKLHILNKIHFIRGVVMKKRDKDKQLREFTPLAVILGMLIAIVFGAA